MIYEITWQWNRFGWMAWTQHELLPVEDWPMDPDKDWFFGRLV